MPCPYGAGFGVLYPFTYPCQPVIPAEAGIQDYSWPPAPVKAPESARFLPGGGLAPGHGAAHSRGQLSCLSLHPENPDADKNLPL